MEIRCEKCSTSYSLDERLLSPSGTPVRCTQCNHVFSAFPPNQVKPNPKIPWQLKTRDGASFQFQSLTELQAFVEEQRTCDADEVSRFGGPWKRIDSMPELSSFLSSRPSPAQATPVPHQKEPTSGESPNSQRPTMSGSPIRQMERSETASAVAPVSKQRTTIPPPGVSNAAPTPTTTTPPRESLLLGNTLPAGPAPTTTPPRESLLLGNTLPVGPALTTTPPRESLLSGKTLPQTPLSTTDTLPTAPSSVNISTSGANPPTDTRESDIDFSTLPTASQEQWSTGPLQAATPDPQWTQDETISRTTVIADDDWDDDFTNPKTSSRRRIRLWLILLSSGLLLGAAGFAGMTYFDQIRTIFGAAQDSKNEERQDLLLLDAQEKVLMDSEQNYAEAEKIYLQVLAINSQNIQAMSELSRMYAVWAQYLLDDHLDIQADLDPAIETEEALSKLLESSRKAFETRIEDARMYARKALSQTPENPLAHLAMADVERLSQNTEKARFHLNKGRDPSTQMELTYVEAMIAIEENRDRSEIVGMLKSAVATTPVLHILYRIARIQGAMARTAEAHEALETIFSLNKSHVRGRKLKARLNDEKTVLLHQQLPDSVEESSTQLSETIPVTGDTKPPVTTPESRATTASAHAPQSDDPLSRATRLQQTGRPREAIQIYETILSSNPNHVEALVGSAYGHMDIGSHGQAVALFNRALKINSRYRPAIIGMAQTYKEMGQPRVAITWYERYLETNPTGPDAPMARRNIERLREQITPSDSTTTIENRPVTTTTDTTSRPDAPTPTIPEPTKPPPSDEPSAPVEPTGSGAPSASGNAPETTSDD